MGQTLRHRVRCGTRACPPNSVGSPGLGCPYPRDASLLSAPHSRLLVAWGTPGPTRPLALPSIRARSPPLPLLESALARSASHLYPAAVVAFSLPHRNSSPACLASAASSPPPQTACTNQRPARSSTNQLPRHNQSFRGLPLSDAAAACCYPITRMEFKAGHHVSQ